MVDIDAFAQAFGFDAKSDDVWTALGKVTAVNGNKLSVLLGGSSTPIECESYCIAAKGDIVFVAISNGKARAIAAKGKSTNGGLIATHSAINSKAADNGVSADTWPPDVIGEDANGLQTSFFGEGVYANGDIRAGIWAYNNDSGGNRVCTNALTVGARKDGTKFYSVDDPTAFLSAIGLNVYGSLYNQSSALTLTTSGQKIPLSTFNGNGCTLSSNGIKVPSTGTYIVWGSAYFMENYTAADILHLEIVKGSTVLCDAVFRAQSANAYEVFSPGPVIATCAANDVLYLYAYNQTAARGNVTSKNGVGLTVLKIA